MQSLILQYIRGQCYDGASSMAGARSGCSAIIKEKVPLVQYHHCAAHRLNLAIVSACKIAAFKNTESYIGEIVNSLQRGSDFWMQRYRENAQKPEPKN